MPNMQPHVFILNSGAPAIHDEPEYQWCICGLRADNPVHADKTVMEFFETQIKELKERLNKIPTANENVEVTVIVTDSKSTQIFNMEMKNFEMDEQFYDPEFLDTYSYLAVSSRVKSITFTGEPVAKKDGTYYKHIQQKRD